MIWLLALYPFGGATLLPFFTGHTTRVELVLIAVFWPACWALIAAMAIAALVELAWHRWLRRIAPVR